MFIANLSEDPYLYPMCLIMYSRHYLHSHIHTQMPHPYKHLHQHTYLIHASSTHTHIPHPPSTHTHTHTHTHTRTHTHTQIKYTQQTSLHSSMWWQRFPAGFVQAGRSVLSVVACDCSYCHPAWSEVIVSNIKHLDRCSYVRVNGQDFRGLKMLHPSWCTWSMWPSMSRSDIMCQG